MGSNTSRAFVLLGLMLAIVLIISSEVAAKDLTAQTKNTKEETLQANAYEDYGGGGMNGGPRAYLVPGDPKPSGQRGYKRDTQTTAEPHN